MKAKNYKTIRLGYFRFFGGLLASVAIACLFLWGFLSTAVHEAGEIERRNEAYNRTYLQQIQLTEKVDSLYNYFQLLGSNEPVNQVVLQRVVSTRKMQFIDAIEILDPADVLLYKGLASRINDFLSVREAIRKVKEEERIVREDLLRCIQDNKQAARKLSAGAAEF